ncbi:hypothetical protein [Lamprobacter modestohalophilus]|uniref:hypothetical protein n=1 Tax=Lamprobacter modestohalophilus TaxID=1064514 RepID=UPI001902D23F|nr:hypothetical protein [Lamprobacter modestohalophilus]
MGKGAVAEIALERARGQAQQAADVAGFTVEIGQQTAEKRDRSLGWGWSWRIGDSGVFVSVRAFGNQAACCPHWLDNTRRIRTGAACLASAERIDGLHVFGAEREVEAVALISVHRLIAPTPFACGSSKRE